MYLVTSTLVYNQVYSFW